MTLSTKNSKAPAIWNCILSRKLQERRTFPAVDIERSSTRREDLLLGPDLLQRVWLMRRMFIQMISPRPQGAGMDNSVATEAIITRERDFVSQGK
jgi:transcription termination factor Rho